MYSTITYKIRKILSKSKNNYYRKNNFIPAIIYGKFFSKSLNILISEKEIIKNKYIFFQFKKNVNNYIILKNKNNIFNTIIKEIQYHPYKLKIIHIDFFILNK